MYAEIERLIRDILELDDSMIYDVTMSDEDGELQIHTRFPVDLIRDILLDYYWRNTDTTAVHKTLVTTCKLDPLNVIELVGAVDELRTKNKTNLP